MGTRRAAAAIAAALIMVAAALVAATGASAVRGGKYRPVVATKTGGVVATESLEASRVARHVLGRGGNAVDAAVSAVFAMGVTRPQSCGIGGGGFMVYRSAGGRIDALDFRETAPAAVRADTFAGPGPHKQFTGHRTIGVPGTVAGMAAALKRYGTISLADAVAPAYDLAATGFPIPGSFSGEAARQTERLRTFPETARNLLTSRGIAPAPGTKLVQTDLALTLRGIGLEGPDYFYRGPVAKAIVGSMATASQQLDGDVGLMTAADLAAYKAVWRTPVTGSYRGFGIVGMPPPTSGGVAIIEMLNLLEGYDLRAAGQSSADELHLLAEAQKLAFADRGAYLADPDQVPQPVETLTSKEYAASRRPEIDPAVAKTYKPGTVPLAGAARREGRDFNPRGSTTHVSVIDARGNAVSVTCTIEQSFGSAVTAPGTGVLLNNELTDFSDPGTANEPAPGKRPRSSMSPTIVTRDARPVLAIGGAGGARIIEGVLHGIVNTVDFGQDPADALDTERIDAAGSALSIEEGRIPVAVRDDLIRRGHKLAPKGEYDVTPRVNAAGYDAVRGALVAASDPRADIGALASNRPPTGGASSDADEQSPTVRWRKPRRLEATRGRDAVRLRWRARDEGGAGIASATVQIRRRLAGGGSAPWTTVALDRRGRSLTLIATRRTRRVQFRIRVTDRAGNVSGYRTLSHRF
ncbi:MAG TPA: gamma-glutamyltransferase [Solirubrobacteraceae bacterium]|jgi:gamma-glutamyltranspeptidase/glutathione hydrolase